MDQIFTMNFWAQIQNQFFLNKSIRELSDYLNIWTISTI